MSQIKRLGLFFSTALVAYMLVFASFSYVGSDEEYLGCADHIFSVTTVQLFWVGTRLLIGNS